MRRVWFPILVVSVLLVAAGCRSTAPSPERADDVSSSPAPANTGGGGAGGGEAAGREDEPEPAPVPEELRFSAATVGGGRYDGEDHAGEDLALWFWAPW